jgi:hypothetical protein
LTHHIKVAFYKQNSEYITSDNYKYSATIMGAGENGTDIIETEWRPSYAEVFDDLFAWSIENKTFLRDCGGYRVEEVMDLIRIKNKNLKDHI